MLYIHFAPANNYYNYTFMTALLRFIC